MIFQKDLFKDSVVVLTGAGNGIGRSALLAFHEAGATVIAHLGKTERYRDSLPNDIHAFTGDFCQLEQQDLFIDFVKTQAGSRGINVLINNAGTMFGRFPADALTDEQYNDIVSLNQTAVVRVCRGLIPKLIDTPNSAIINTVSISASTGGSPGSAIYSASKAFVSTYTKALARELAPHGVRANAVSPGVIATDFHERYSNTEKLENTRKQIPLQRLGNADDCAPTFLFLGSEKLSGYITGQVIEINGGLY